MIDFPFNKAVTAQINHTKQIVVLAVKLGYEPEWSWKGLSQPQPFDISRCLSSEYALLEKWLWDEYKITVWHIKINLTSDNIPPKFQGRSSMNKSIIITETDTFDSPIDAKINSIQKTVQYLNRNKVSSNT